MGVLQADKQALLEKAQTKGWVIGLKEITGVTGIRKDIDHLILKEPESFNIFVLALQALQAPERTKKAEDWMNYFQVAGIHGLPMNPWAGEVNFDQFNINKDKKTRDEDGAEDGGIGYCHHGHLGFGPWHRPYLAMMEQTIFYEMVKIADKSFPEEKYYDAVRNWRLPFWDYYRPRGGAVKYYKLIKTKQGSPMKINWSKIFEDFGYDCGVPDIFTMPALMVRKTAKSELQPIENPFYHFALNQKGGLDSTDFEAAKLSNYDRNVTLRWPKEAAHAPQNLQQAFDKITQRSINSETQREITDALNTAINFKREGNIRLLWSMMNDPSYAKFTEFATPQQTPGVSGNLEITIHGAYHDLIGGPGGHMSEVPIAAFDPVFWMHHCQVDRLFAIWQKIHPRSWFTKNDGDAALQRKIAAAWFDPDRVLSPFRTALNDQMDKDLKDRYWTANSSRKPSSFGYEYPETASTDDPLEIWDKAYNWSWRPSKTEKYGDCPDKMQPRSMLGAQVYQFTSSSIQAFDTDHSGKGPSLQVQHRMASEPVPEIKPVEVLPESEAPASVQTTISPSDRSFTNLPDEDPSKVVIEDIDETQVSRSWYVDMLVERLALNGSFGIHFFLGEFEDDPHKYYLQPTSAGTNNVFAAPIEACDNCGRQEEQALLVTDTADITPTLLNYKKAGLLLSTSAQDVVPFLKKQLKWRVATAAGVQVDPRTISSLKLGVSSRLAPVSPATGDIRYQEFPEVIEHIIGNAS